MKRSKLQVHKMTSQMPEEAYGVAQNKDLQLAFGPPEE